MVPNAILFSLKIGVWGRYNRDMERNLRGADKERKGDKMFGFGKKKEAEKSRVTVCKDCLLYTSDVKSDRCFVTAGMWMKGILKAC